MAENDDSGDDRMQHIVESSSQNSLQPRPLAIKSIAGFLNLIDNFRGEKEESIGYFFEQVEEIAEAAEWGDREKILVVKAKLKGIAAEYLREEPELRQTKSYETLKTDLLGRFEVKKPLSATLQKILTCNQRVGEKVQQYATRLKGLGKSYLVDPKNVEVSKLVRNQTLCSQFLNGITPGIKRYVLSRKPEDFQSAVEVAVDEENNLESCSRAVLTCATEGSEDRAQSKEWQKSLHHTEGLTNQIKKLTLQLQESQKELAGLKRANEPVEPVLAANYQPELRSAANTHERGFYNEGARPRDYGPELRRPNRYPQIETQANRHGFQNPPETRKCFRCQKIGHISRNCPQAYRRTDGYERQGRPFDANREFPTGRGRTPSTQVTPPVIELNGCNIAVASKLPIVTVKVNGQEVNWLFDTGSAVTLLPKEIFDTLTNKVGLTTKEIPFVIRGVTGQTVKPVGQANLRFTMGERTFTHEVHILPDVLSDYYQGIIGFDLITQQEISYDAQKRELHGSRLKAKMHVKVISPSEVIKAETRVIRNPRKTKLAPGASALFEVNCSARYSQGDLILVEPWLGTRRAKPKVVSSLSTVNQHGKISIEVHNRETTPKFIHQDERLARVRKFTAANLLTGTSRADRQVPVKIPDIDLSHVEGSEREIVQELLGKYTDVFATKMGDLRSTPTAEHTIRLTDDRPIKQQPYRTPYSSRGRGRWVDKSRYGPPTRTKYSLIVENLSSKVSWQDLKDFMRQAGEVTYADAHKRRRNEGVVEFASYSDMKNAIVKLNNTDLNGRCIKLVQENLRRAAELQEERQGRQAVIRQFKEGERVYLYTPAWKKGTTKKLSKLSSGPYVITGIRGTVNYEIRPDQRAGRKQLVHVNRIFKKKERRPDLELVQERKGDNANCADDRTPRRTRQQNVGAKARATQKKMCPRWENDSDSDIITEWPLTSEDEEERYQGAPRSLRLMQSLESDSQGEEVEERREVTRAVDTESTSQTGETTSDEESEPEYDPYPREDGELPGFGSGETDTPVTNEQGGGTPLSSEDGERRDQYVLRSRCVPKSQQ